MYYRIIELYKNIINKNEKEHYKLLLKEKTFWLMLIVLLAYLFLIIYFRHNSNYNLILLIATFIFAAIFYFLTIYKDKKTFDEKSLLYINYNNNNVYEIDVLLKALNINPTVPIIDSLISNMDYHIEKEETMEEKIDKLDSLVTKFIVPFVSFLLGCLKLNEISVISVVKMSISIFSVLLFLYVLLRYFVVWVLEMLFDNYYRLTIQLKESLEYYKIYMLNNEQEKDNCMNCIDKY